MNGISDLQKKAELVRKWCLVSTTEAGSGHPTSCLSSADLGTILFDKFFTYDIKNPHNPNNDRLIFSKGHAAPLLFTLFALSGGLSVEELKTLRRFGSKLEGHPTPEFRYSDAATGSLGQGLSVGAGISLSAKKDQLTFKTYVLLGDGEMAEGSIWEAANFSAYYGLDNLIAIADVNRFGQSQETMFGHRIKEYVKRFKAFGWETVLIDGHNLKEINKAFRLANNNKSGKPFAIIAKTIKGKGISFLENKDNWHGKPLKKDDLEKALGELGRVDDKLRFKLKSPFNKSAKSVKNPVSFSPLVSFNFGEEVATREVYGQALAKIGESNSLIYALDGDTKNSTYSEIFKKANPQRFIECFIAEQNMVGVAVGLSRMGKVPFVSTFAAFLTRAFDQIRMAAISGANLKIVGSHAGVSIGEDGASQMGLEDFAMFGSIMNSIILHPCDGISTAALITSLAGHNGISYLRTLRPKTSVIYGDDEKFEIGGSKVLRSSKEDVITVAACGITVFEALKAYEILKEKGVLIRVVDCYSIKPVDRKTLLKCLEETKTRMIITVEDHYEHGGLGDFVLSALSNSGAIVEKMTINKMPRSGKKDELLAYEGIDSIGIVKKVQNLVAGSTRAFQSMSSKIKRTVNLKNLQQI